MQQVYLSQKEESFRIWAWSCSHLNADLDAASENNIEIATTQLNSEGLSFDFSFCAGDFDSHQTPPDLTDITDGQAIVSALQSLSDIGLTPSGLYRIAGNHDAGDGDMDWFLRYIDPIGENTAYSEVNSSSRPYPITLMEAGSWHSYYVSFGKNILICLSDRNDLPYPYGRAGSVETGGHPSGAITQETWNWTKNLILNNKDKNIFIVTHQNPRNTTIGTGDGDGSIGIGTDEHLHGESGIAAGSGSLYSIYDEDLLTADSPTTAFLQFFEDNPDHTVVMWCAGHSHSYLDEVLNGRGERFDTKGVTFLNLQHLTRYHISGGRLPTHSMSKIFEIDSKKVVVKHYNHQVIDANPVGFYAPLEHEINLKV